MASVGVFAGHCSLLIGEPGSADGIAGPRWAISKNFSETRKKLGFSAAKMVLRDLGPGTQALFDWPRVEVWHPATPGYQAMDMIAHAG